MQIMKLAKVLQTIRCFSTDSVQINFNHKIHNLFLLEIKKTRVTHARATKSRNKNTPPRLMSVTNLRPATSRIRVPTLSFFYLAEYLLEFAKSVSLRHFEQDIIIVFILELHDISTSCNKHNINIARDNVFQTVSSVTFITWPFLIKPTENRVITKLLEACFFIFFFIGGPLMQPISEECGGSL